MGFAFRPRTEILLPSYREVDIVRASRLEAWPPESVASPKRSKHADVGCGMALGPSDGVGNDSKRPDSINKRIDGEDQKAEGEPPSIAASYLLSGLGCLRH